MSDNVRTLLTYLGALAVIATAVLLISKEPSSVAPLNGFPETTQVAKAVSTEKPIVPKAPIHETGLALSLEAETPKAEPVAPPVTDTYSHTETTASSVVRIQNPYSTPPLSFLVVNEMARAALVNILCSAQSTTLQSSSGSGVIIDPRGVILTNAHVAQYVLLAESGQTNLSCVIRTGSPAQVRWGVEVLYIPPIWIRDHAEDIRSANPTGTGEHDYALLRIIPLPESPLPLSSTFPYLPIDTREGVGFPGDPILVASYPSEFVGARATAFNLYPASSITSVKGLLTFESSTVDLLSLAGVQEAQSGSSGGATANAWGFLIGIITTTSEGATTADREMRAVTLSYIDRDMRVQAGVDIIEFLMQDIAALALNFKEKNEETLTDILIREIEK